MLQSILKEIGTYLGYVIFPFTILDFNVGLLLLVHSGYRYFLCTWSLFDIQ